MVPGVLRLILVVPGRLAVVLGLVMLVIIVPLVSRVLAVMTYFFSPTGCIRSRWFFPDKATDYVWVNNSGHDQLS